MSTMFADTLLIVFISVCTALLAEGITWVLVYRTDKYKRLKAEVEKQSKKLEKKKETITESAGRQQKKKIERQEEKLKNNNRDLSMVRMKSMFAIGFCFTALMGMFNSMAGDRTASKVRALARNETQDPGSRADALTTEQNQSGHFRRPNNSMAEWWQSCPSPPCPTSRGCLTGTCWAMTPRTAPSSSCTSSAPCPFGRTSRRSSAWPLRELPPSRPAGSWALHRLRGSSLEVEKNPVIPVVS
ncbi:calcium load-activated calcium channel isoform 2-T2 [Molossus nigricans]|uniref:Calcium load-activated calcium channel n=1 Tax=Molossus molossus TaxID=27622 RepID=A0A7J8CUM8_MOLMO|nr:calcium load-activated calcium channel isoform X2 [Molossus molossus]KAF6414597.1 transmembrane and coiled-coil domains 1 [Molossus molossus]